MTIDVLLGEDLDMPVRTVLGRALDVTAQQIRIRLNRHLGEWFADTRIGMPWMDWVATKPFPLVDASARIRQEIETTPGVVRVDDWEEAFDGAARQAQFSGTAIFEEGDLAFVISPFAGSTTHNRAPWVAIGAVGSVIP